MTTPRVPDPPCPSAVRVTCGACGELVLADFTVNMRCRCDREAEARGRERSCAERVAQWRAATTPP